MALRSFSSLSLSLSLLLPSCNGTRVELVLHGAPDFDPAEELGEITVRIEEAETGDPIGGRGATRVGADAPALEGIDLQEGVAYRAMVEASATRCREEDIAAGRSLPFVHDDGGDVVDLWVGCHGEASAVQDLPEPRALGAVSWVEAEGRALATGGAAFASVTLDGFDDAPREASVFAMDVPTGEWTADLPMWTPRRLHAAVAAGRGLVMLGGAAEGALGLDDSVEVISGAERSPGRALGAQFSQPAATLLASGRILVAGRGFARAEEVPLVVYDPDAGTSEVVDAGVPALRGAALVPLGESDGETALGPGAARVLVVGGAGETQPAAVRMFCEEPCGDCETAPCVVGVPFEGEAPADDWAFMAASYVPCEAGGGAVVVAGGGTGPPGSVVPTDAIFCYRDDPTEVGSMQSSSLALESAREGATAATVERAAGGFWVAVVGGRGERTDPPAYPNDMELVQINGCSCDPTGISVRALPTSADGASTTAGHAVATIGDGSILVVGGFEPLAGIEGLELEATSRVLRIR